eukprot:7203498-Alexandrium_andersonii.AAC.1
MWSRPHPPTGYQDGPGMRFAHSREQSARPRVLQAGARFAGCTGAPSKPHRRSLLQERTGKHAG